MLHTPLRDIDFLEPREMPATDEAEFEAFERFREYLLMVGRGMIGRSYRGKFDTEELVNQTLFEAFEHRHEFRGSTDGERALWLRRILADNIRDAIRFLHRDKRDVDREQRLAVCGSDQSRTRLLDLTGKVTSPSMKAVKRERELQVARALAQLPPDQREAIEWHHLEGATLRETAEQMDRSAASVAGLLRRGLKRLRELLQEEDR
jgi:RNA polymerase sigma-70 factor (ECF subfamily)